MLKLDNLKEKSYRLTILIKEEFRNKDDHFSVLDLLFILTSINSTNNVQQIGKSN